MKKFTTANVAHRPPEHTQNIANAQDRGAEGIVKISESVCVSQEIGYFESVLGVRRADEYLMMVPPLLGAQTDDLLTFRHPDPDELLTTGLSVTSAMPAPGGTMSRVDLQSRPPQVSLTGPPPAESQQNSAELSL